MVLHQNILTLPIPIRYHLVQGHTDDMQSFHDLTLPQQLNVMADDLAKRSLLGGINMTTTLHPWYPTEQIRILLSGSKITSSILNPIYKHWGHRIMASLFQRCHIVSPYYFSKIAWDHFGA